MVHRRNQKLAFIFKWISQPISIDVILIIHCKQSLPSFLLPIFETYKRENVSRGKHR